MKVTLSFEGSDYITLDNVSKTINEQKEKLGDKFLKEFMYVVKTQQYSLWHSMGATRENISVIIDGEEVR